MTPSAVLFPSPAALWPRLVLVLVPSFIQISPLPSYALTLLSRPLATFRYVGLFFHI